MPICFAFSCAAFDATTAASKGSMGTGRVVMLRMKMVAQLGLFIDEVKLLSEQLRAA